MILFEDAPTLGLGTISRLRMGGGSPPAPAGGPVRAPTPATGNIGLGGHSSLLGASSTQFGAREELVNLWPAPGAVVTSAGQTSADVWSDAGGGLRNATDYGFVVLSELDDFDTGYPAPDSAQGISNLQHLYWLGLLAIDKGCADLFLYLSPSHRDIDRDAGNRQIFGFMAAWLQSKLGIPVYVIDAAWVIAQMRQSLPDSALYADYAHYTQRTGRAFGWAVWAAITGALPAGATTADAVGAAAVEHMLDNYWWAGRGGAQGGDSWTGADPLPDPAPRPGTGPVLGAGEIEYTAAAYDGPVLAGNAPTVAGNVMTFDASGQWAPDNLALGSAKYICAAIRFSAVPGDASVLFFSSDATSLYANPQLAIEISGGNWRGLFYDDGVEIQALTGIAVTTDWTIVELWSSGTTIGISIDGGADVTGTLPTAAPDTDSLRLFWVPGGTQSVYVATRAAAPDQAGHADIR